MSIVIRFFTSPTCATCNKVRSALNKITERYGLEVVEYPIDEKGFVFRVWQVSGVPLIILDNTNEENGGEVARIVGLQSETSLEYKFKKYGLIKDESIN